MQGWLGLIHCVAFTVMIASMFKTFRTWWVALNASLLIGLMVSLLGLFQMTGGGGQRISSSLGNPTFLGGYALVNALIAAGLLAYALATPRKRSPAVSSRKSRQSLLGRDRWWKMHLFDTNLPLVSFWVTTIGLNLLMLFQSGTRGAMLGLAASLGLMLTGYAIADNLRITRLVAGSLMLASTVLIISLYFLQGNDTVLAWATDTGNPSLQRLVTVSFDDSSVRTRLYSVYAGWEGFKDRLWLGWGPENYSAVYDQYISEYAVATSPIEHFDQAHNRVIEELATTGLVGLVGYLAIWGSMALILIRKMILLPTNGHLLVLSIGGALVGYFMQNLFLFDTPGTVVQLYLLIGFAVYLETTLVQTAVSLDPDPGLHDGANPGFRARAGRPQALMKGTLVILGNAVVLVCFFVAVLEPYTGAYHALIATDNRRPLDKQFEAMYDAVDAAPRMTAGPWLVLMEQLIRSWNDLTPTERQWTLDLAQGEGAAILMREPWEWRVHSKLAQIYQMASLTEWPYLAWARDHTDQAAAIAPNRVEIMQLQAQQYVFERDVASALGLIDAYLARTAEFRDERFEVHGRLVRQRERIAELE